LCVSRVRGVKGSKAYAAKDVAFDGREPGELLRGWQEFGGGQIIKGKRVRER